MLERQKRRALTFCEISTKNGTSFPRICLFCEKFWRSCSSGLLKVDIIYKTFTYTQYICIKRNFLISFLDAMTYRRKYLREIDFDNVYVSNYFLHLEKRRAQNGQRTLLPLKKVYLFYRYNFFGRSGELYVIIISIEKDLKTKAVNLKCNMMKVY